jgi:hypothetical protein
MKPTFWVGVQSNAICWVGQRTEMSRGGADSTPQQLHTTQLKANKANK